MATKKIKSGMLWCPTEIVREVECIKTEKGIMKTAEAMKKMAAYSLVGRESEKVLDGLRWFKRKK